jgi:hypothetical protein
MKELMFLVIRLEVSIGKDPPGLFFYILKKYFNSDIVTQISVYVEENRGLLERIVG